jgi:hypothetical protein
MRTQVAAWRQYAVQGFRAQGGCRCPDCRCGQSLTIIVQPATRAHARWKCWAQLRSAHLRVAPFWPQWLQRVARPRLMAPGRCICNQQEGAHMQA